MGKDAVASIEKKVESFKKKLKKICCCGFCWTFLGIVLFAIGVGLLVAYVKYWDNDSKAERVGAYIGVALLLVGIIFAAIGIVLCVSLCLIYKRSQQTGMKKFTPPNFAPGEAPYPQQPLYNPEASPAHHASAPSAPTANDDVKVEISEHTKF